MHPVTTPVHPCTVSPWPWPPVRECGPAARSLLSAAAISGGTLSSACAEHAEEMSWAGLLVATHAHAGHRRQAVENATLAVTLLAVWGGDIAASETGL